VRVLLYGLAGLVVLGAIVFFFVAAPLVDRQQNPVASPPPYPVSDAAATLHESLYVADLHNDLLLWNRDPLQRHDYGHSDVPRLLDGGVGLQVFSVVTKVPFGASYSGTEDGLDQIGFLVAGQRWPVRTWTSRVERALYQAQRLRNTVDRSDGRVVLMRTASDVTDLLDARASGQSNRLGTLLAIEGLHALDGNADNVDRLVDAGYRMMAPVHLHDNALGGSSTGVDRGGLTDFGREVVRRMQEHGVVLDLAHASAPLLDDLFAMTDRPVVVSHTGVDGTCPGARNLSDRHVDAVAARGGVIGIGAWPGAVCGSTPGHTARAMRYVADRVGVDHVALGTDFDGTVTPPFDATGLPQLTEALMEEGFTDAQIRKIMGENVARVLKEALPTGDS